MNKYFRFVLITFVFTLFLASGSGILAQAEPDPAPAQNDSAQTDGKEKEKNDKVEERQLDEISITATRVKRKTQNVPASMTVVGKEAIEDAKMHNIKDALSGAPGVQVDSKNGGYDSRLIIRGAGVKARYGIREIMILLNGVPITDPDGFSKLDLLDPQQIEQIEVVKGPNSTLWGANAAGGVVNIITRSPLKETGGYVKIGGGEYGERSSSFYYADNIDNFMMYSVSGSYLANDNTWRDRNEYRAYNVAFQPVFVFDDGTTWENYFSYNKSDLQLPGAIDQVLFQEYERTGDLKISDARKALLRIIDGKLNPDINPWSREDPWKYSGRYSDSAFFSSRLTKELGNFTLKPMIYGNKWTHDHPIPGSINVSESYVYGGDLQVDWKHKFGTLTFGGMSRMDRQEGKRYKYQDIVVTPFINRITEVNSDIKGDLADTSSNRTLLAGAYIQESMDLFNKLIVDIGARYDEIDFDLKGHIDSYYDWSAGNYIDCTISMTDCGQPVRYEWYHIRKIYKAASPRIGVSYKMMKNLSLYANVASGIQTPTTSEISSNPSLKLVRYTNYEIGLKGRGKSWMFDTSVYKGIVENEVVPRLTLDGETEFSNAGRTRKDGFEMEGAYFLTDSFSIGGSYTRTKYLYLYFMEASTDPKTYRPVEYDRGGKTLPHIPTHQYSFFLQYRNRGGFKARVQTVTWSSYYIDTANSEKYEGVKWITSLMLGYQIENKLDFTLIVQNALDRRYAVEVQKQPVRGKYYSVAPPRTVSLSLTAKF